MYEAIAPEDLRMLHADDASLLVQNEILKSRISDLEGTAAEYKEQLRDAREIRGSRKGKGHGQKPTLQRRMTRISCTMKNLATWMEQLCLTSYDT